MSKKDLPVSRKEIEKRKRRIIALFNKNVRGRRSDTSNSHERHDGKEGHWLEVRMNIKHNAKNEPDLDGFEMKNHTGSKTTFGDWSADYYIFNDSTYDITRDEFLKIFGGPNLKKNGRFSWSGAPCPKVGSCNTFGQRMTVDRLGNIFALYNFEKDLRKEKKKIVPPSMRKRNLILAKWEAVSIKKKLEKKFNKLGWFKCIQDKNGVYSKIGFGNAINFKLWITGVRKGLVFFDSGMYQGNPRPYSQWRASNKYWEGLMVEKY